MPESQKNINIDEERSNKIFTIPNILSALRILLVPVFVVFYFLNSQNHFWVAFWALVAIYVSDVLDGFIARKFHMISKLGKILDPLADKLSQAAVAVCLAISNPLVLPLVVVIFIKELLMLAGAVKLFRTGLRPAEAKWWGKISTAVINLILILFLLDVMFGPFLSVLAIQLFNVLALVCIVFAMSHYYPLFKQILTGKYNPDIDDLNN